MEVIREPKVADIFYPAKPRELNLMIEDFLDKEKSLNLAKKDITALIVPHAGYIYSGKVAAVGFKQIIGRNFKKIILVGPSHYEYFKGVVLSSARYWQTPLGKVEIFYPEKILKNKNCFFFETAYNSEHCLEVELPFLQKVLKNFQIIPLLYGEIDYNLLAEIISDCLDKDFLIVISSDLSHYLNYQKAKIIDGLTIHKILNLSLVQTEKIEACGKTGILALLKLAKEKKWQPRLIKYLNSGDTSGQKNRVVGYASFIFYK